MISVRACLIVISLGVAAAALATALAADKPAEGKASALPALKMDQDAPLLLDEPPAKKDATPPTGPVADNTACYVCHTNYQEESMVVEHAKVNVGCVNCHGQSFDHRNDEDNITPPDIMYPTAKIDPGCQKCHEQHDVAATLVIDRWQQRCPAKTNPKDIVCTDCHGEHRLKSRTVRWNKETRTLITGKGPEGSRGQGVGAGE
jgi:hypothetical protein